MDNEIAGFGRRDTLAAELAELGEPGLSAGRVVAAHRARWAVATGGETLLLPARGRLRETPPVTGDWVAIDPGGAIAAVLERRGSLVRRAPGEATASQTLAANVDLALVVEPLPDPNERRLERLVALALADGVPAVLVLTKADLAEEDADGRPGGAERFGHGVGAQSIATELARHLGLADGVAVSARDGSGVGILRTLLGPGATAVLLGASGAGKSTLANALLGEERQATQPVRAADGRGRHTTVTRELIALPGGALLVDTPGLRAVGVWDGAGAAFDEIERLAAGCRFADCRHESEPGCAVREVVDPERLAAWRKLEREQARLDDRKAAALARKQSGRLLSRQVREALRAKGRW
jgi:ribosome biogenesis GTPase / thiamine phosphate phosphatase